MVQRVRLGFGSAGEVEVEFRNSVETRPGTRQNQRDCAGEVTGAPSLGGPQEILKGLPKIFKKVRGLLEILLGVSKKCSKSSEGAFVESPGIKERVMDEKHLQKE